MKVTLIASTHMDWVVLPLEEPYSNEFLDAFGGVTNRMGNTTEQWMKQDEDDSDADVLAEFAGRACYQSFHKPNPSTAANDDYIANIIFQGHESVLEHASATFYVIGVSRALTHELIRHRHLSYSEMSQRFVDLENTTPVFPPAIDQADAEEWVTAENAYSSALEDYKYLVELLEAKGFTRKQAREAARAVMPNATETRIVVTGNMRAWRDVIKKRFHVAADAEIREFAGEVLSQLRTIAPNTFQDFPEEPFA
ncbi:FAD-dependent thymidylate synthase [Saccharopolyspora pogona]|uniref:FAD-dependent thymidylate synthase n=1 Tax=Saccharopolyspora pogona TaxID=333966 RepID=UPI001CC265B6|nr:FAD-dependent thymidylate synthase [Saccharopolyspora pogona]